MAVAVVVVLIVVISSLAVINRSKPTNFTTMDGDGVVVKVLYSALPASEDLVQTGRRMTTEDTTPLPVLKMKKLIMDHGH
jgi:hypothetical protein